MFPLLLGDSFLKTNYHTLLSVVTSGKYLESIFKTQFNSVMSTVKRAKFIHVISFKNRKNETDLPLSVKFFKLVCFNKVLLYRYWF